MSAELRHLLRKVLIGVLSVLSALILFYALLISGVTYLLKALCALLTPLVGVGWAYCITGGVCLGAIILFFLVLTLPRRRRKKSRGTAGNAALDSTRRLIRQNPWEAASAALILGYSMEGDSQVRRLLLEAGITYLRNQGKEPGRKNPGVDPAANDEEA